MAILSSWMATFLPLFLLFVPLVRYFRRPKGLPTPPGPRRLPLVGNLLQMPTSEQWKVYSEWTKEYGDMIYLEAAGQPILVLNSLSSINELLISRAANYSDRPASPIVDITKHWWNTAVMRYTQKWRDHRRTLHLYFNQTRIHRCRPLLELEIPSFLRSVLDTPKGYDEAMRTFLGMAILRISYGADDLEYNRKVIEGSDRLVREQGESLEPGRYLMAFIPCMRHIPSWIPGAGWKRALEDLGRLNDEMVSQPFEDAKERLRTGTRSRGTWSMAPELIESLPSKDDPEYAYKEEIARNVTAITYMAGADTTASSARALALALAKYPEVQRKAQKEIDAEVGSGTLPTFDDLDRLHYLRAIVKEVGRWHNVLPLSVPHVSKDEDVFRGYRIPANTMVLPNIWAVMHDPKIFEDPLEFKPERYLKNGKIDPSVLDPEGGSFGYGRRICPGRHLAEEMLALMAACLLSCFNLYPGVDDAGNPIPLALKVSTSLITAPLPFECQAVPRSQQHVALIKTL